MIRPLRRLPFRSLLLSLPLALVLAACEQGAGPGGPEAETVSVTLAPSLSPHGLATQGISGDLVISDVLVQVRDARGDLGDLGPVFWFDPDGNVVSEGSSEGSTELSIWDGTGVVPTTLQLPVRDDTGADIPYDFLLNVRSRLEGPNAGITTTDVATAFASASVPLLQDGTTITFANLTSLLADALLLPVDPLSADSDCPIVEGLTSSILQFPPETLEVEPGDLVSLFLAPIAPGTGAAKCIPQYPESPFVPFPDFGVGAASVLLDGVDITDDALPVNPSKRGMLVQVPDDALSGATIEVSLTASGTGFGAGGTTTDGFVTATAPVVETATVSLQVVESPVELPVGAGGLDVDLTAPEILSYNFDNGVTQVDIRVGPSDDPADVDSVVGFVGPKPLALQFVQSFDSTSSPGVIWRALVCNDFSAIAPIPGDVTTLDATFYAIDPDGNQSEPYTVPITVTATYGGPSGSCSTTVDW